MCGIVGYTGPRSITEVIVDGLEKLEYRGYDSAGIAFICNEQLKTYKKQGRLACLAELLENINVKNTAGIGHTRWATHGAPSDINSHPHTNMAGNIAVVHNGIIENHAQLRSKLISSGVKFASETDTEVIAHLIDANYTGDLLSAVTAVLPMLEGSYAIGVVSASEPGKIIAARKGSPLVIGVCENENFIASDIPAILKYTSSVYFMNEDEIASITSGGIELFDNNGNKKDFSPVTVEFSADNADKGAFAHYMLKEIHEQPLALADTLMPRINGDVLDLSDSGLTEEIIRSIEHITIVACGTAYHAGCVGGFALEKLARIPVDMDIASEFRYRDPIWKKNQLVIVVSQSGETADTIAAMREAQVNGIKVLAVTNVQGSTIAREADYVLHTHAGIEIAVASTKAYTAQLMAMYMLTLEFARVHGKMDIDTYKSYVKELKSIPAKAKIAIDENMSLEHFAEKRIADRSTFFIGRGFDHMLAMEGALKLKEISYIHAEAYAAGELKHGTIALIEENTLVVAMCTQSSIAQKTASNIQELKARGAYVLGISKISDKHICKVCDKMICVPDTCDLFAPILAIIPTQIFAYFMALKKGCDVDKPRNLAKSVTVE